MIRILMMVSIAALPGCATYDVPLSEDTHRRAVVEEVKMRAMDWSADYRMAGQSVTLSFSVSPSGAVIGRSASGGTPQSQHNALSIIGALEPFPPHDGDDPIEYEIPVRYD